MRVLDRYKFFASSLLGVIIIFILINLIALGILKHSQSDNQEALLYDLINYDAFTNQKLSIQIDSSDVNSMLEVYIRFLKSKKPAIVDLIHYSPSFNQYLASAVSTYISIDNLKTHTMEEESATGHFFDY